MIERELRVNFKNFILWMSILIGMFLMVFLIYPFIITDESIKSLDEMMKSLPPELLKSFNMDITTISTAYGWLKSEGFMFVLLIVGIYSSVLGCNILLKEEYDKTIEYLGVLPVTKSKIVSNKIIVSFLYIVAMVIILGVFNYIALELSGDFNHKQYLLLSITPLFVGFPLFAISLFLSTFVHKKSIGISIGLVFLFYVLNLLSEISTKVEFLKYFSIYTLADVRNVISDICINPLMVIVSLLITIVFTIGTYMKYNKKEFI